MPYLIAVILVFIQKLFPFWSKTARASGFSSGAAVDEFKSQIFFEIRKHMPCLAVGYPHLFACAFYCPVIFDHMQEYGQFVIEDLILLGEGNLYIRAE